MATPPVFSAGAVLTAAQMNAVGMWRVTTCTVSSAGGTAATASNGVITIGSGNTSVTVNNAFSADFDNYCIIIASVDASTSDQISTLTFGSTTTGYYGSLTLQSYGSASPTILNRNNAASLYLIASDTDATHFMSFDVYSPNLAQRTGISGTGFGYTYTSWFGGFVANTTAYTNFTIASGAGTMTGGTIRVYGYRN